MVFYLQKCFSHPLRRTEAHVTQLEIMTSDTSSETEAEGCSSEQMFPGVSRYKGHSLYSESHLSRILNGHPRRKCRSLDGREFTFFRL